jgi:hypothetical protein
VQGAMESPYRGRVMQNRMLKMCKVQSSHHTEEQTTWEREEELKAEF